MNSASILLLLIIPLAGAIVCAFLGPALARGWALFVGLATLAAAIVVAVQLMQGNPPAFHAGVSGVSDMPALGFSFSLGINQISVWLVLLTAFLTPLAIAASFGSIRERQNE